jgi:hypothetical protein
MRITSEGLVGIGTSTPAFSLDITTVSNTGGDVVARLNATAAAGQTDADASFILDAGALVTATVTAGAFVIGTRYRIATVGTTNFTLIGASANTVGISFVATGAGSGTGTAVTTASGESEILFRNSSFDRAYVGWNDDTGILVIDANTGGNDGSIRLTADGGTGVVDIRGSNNGLTGITSRNTLRFSDSDTTTAGNQPIGVIEFYSEDSTAGGTGVSAYILSAAAGTSGGGNLVFGTAPSAGSGSPVQRMVIQSGGNVGIGITPTQKLHVDGNILTTGSIDAGTQFLGQASDTVSAPSYSWTGDTNCGIYRPAADTIGLVTAGVERARVTSAGLFQFNSGYGSVATAFGCRAWVNFNGTGTVAIRASGNVSSITDDGLGLFTVNFTTAMPDVNYSVTGAGMRNINSGGPNQCVNLRRSTTYSDAFQLSSVSLSVGNGADGLADPLACCIAVFR